MMPRRQAQNYFPIQKVFIILIVIIVAFGRLILDLQESGMLVF
jgi:hypothetical protein